MEPAEQVIIARAMVGYERSRLKHAVLAAVPTLVLPLIAFIVGGRLVPSVLLGVLMWGAVVGLGWRGQAWGLSVPAGLKAGVVPLALALTAQRIGHVCTPEGCASVCVPMCSAGGVVAGMVVAWAARRSPAPWITIGAGLFISAAVGAMGCSCVGMSGTLAMGIGLVAGVALASVVQSAR